MDLLLTALISFTTLVCIVLIPDRREPSLANHVRRLCALFLLAVHCFRTVGRTRAHRALVHRPRVAYEMIFTVTRFTAVLVHAHAVVEHLSGRTRAHFGRQVLAPRFAGPQCLVVVARLFAAGRTGFVGQSYGRKKLKISFTVRPHSVGVQKLHKY